MFWKTVQLGKPYLVVADLHRELGTLPESIKLICLGDVIRIQPNHISFNNINAIDDIYGHNTKTNKGETYTAALQTSKYPPSIISELYIILQYELIVGIKPVMDFSGEL